jgi:hypothetical protein
MAAPRREPCVAASPECCVCGAGIMERGDLQRAELSVSDQSQVGPLQEFLGWAVPDISVSRITGKPRAGEQGALDVVGVLAGSSGLVAAVRVLPEFLRSRKTGLSITATVKGEPFTLTATNVDEVMPILEKLLDG